MKEVRVSGNMIKNKKVTELVRKYGFRGQGFEVKSYFLPLVQNLAKSLAKRIENPIYYIVSLRRPSLINTFFKIFEHSHHTRNLA